MSPLYKEHSYDPIHVTYAINTRLVPFGFVLKQEI